MNSTPASEAQNTRPFAVRSQQASHANGTAPERAEKPLKVLMSAYSCSPHLGSEPGVGWNSVYQTAQRHEVWVLTAAEQREAIEAELKDNPMPNVHWSFIDIPQWMRWWKKGERGRRIHYTLWQYWAYLEGKRLHQQVSFDVVHHVTFVSYWTPSYLSMLGVPFVWGPVGGGDSTPESFYPTLSRKSQISERVRDTIRSIFHHGDPFLRVTARRAAVALPTSEGTAAKIRALGAKNVRVMSECALNDETIALMDAKPERPADQPFRVISMGRLLGWKAYHLGIEAFARLHRDVPDSEYLILGSGEELERLKALAAALGVTDSVKFVGLVPREEALHCLLTSDVLLHPSLHDTGSWVSLEAMASGTPIVCLKLGGLATIVSDECGFRVNGSDPQTSVAELHEALLKLANNPALREQMGAAGKQRLLDEFRWQRKGEQYNQIYREVVRANGG